MKEIKIYVVFYLTNFRNYENIWVNIWKNLNKYINIVLFWDLQLTDKPNSSNIKCPELIILKVKFHLPWAYKVRTAWIATYTPENW